MHYGYMMVYKDKAGYEIPLYEPYRGNMLGVNIIFSNKKDAEYAMCQEIIQIKETLQFGHKVISTETKWLFFKRDTITHIPVNEDNRRQLQNIINTIKVKKVKVV